MGQDLYRIRILYQAQHANSSRIRPVRDDGRKSQIQIYNRLLLK
jgi:hypothetical protein